jgi:hypothetical protein
MLPSAGFEPRTVQRVARSHELHLLQPVTRNSAENYVALGGVRILDRSARSLIKRPTPTTTTLTSDTPAPEVHAL